MRERGAHVPAFPAEGPVTEFWILQFQLQAHKQAWVMFQTRNEPLWGPPLPAWPTHGMRGANAVAAVVSPKVLRSSAIKQ